MKSTVNILKLVGFFIISTPIFLYTMGVLTENDITDPLREVTGFVVIVVVYALWAMAGHLIKQQYLKRKKAANPPKGSTNDNSQNTSNNAPQIATKIHTTAQNPFVIKNPVLGLLNLIGADASALMTEDLNTFGKSFPKNVNVGIGQVPKCNVLFLYCSFESNGQITGKTVSLIDVIRAAGAHIVVIASEAKPEIVTNPAFGQFLTSNKEWPANIVFTMARNGVHFGSFFTALFADMRTGTSMPMAWVKIAPQSPQQPENIPGTIMALQAGHIAFST